MSQYKFIKIACFGEATSQFLEEETGRKVDYIGNSNAKQVSNDLSLVVGDELITFIIGNNSLRSVQKEIKSSSKLEERIIYKNEAVENVNLEQYNIALLTSPMNTKAFFDLGGSADKYIAIGETTKSTLQKYVNNVNNVHVAEHPSEQGLLKSLQAVIAAKY